MESTVSLVVLRYNSARWLGRCFERGMTLPSLLGSRPLKARRPLADRCTPLKSLALITAGHVVLLES